MKIEVTNCDILLILPILSCHSNCTDLEYVFLSYTDVAYLNGILQTEFEHCKRKEGPIQLPRLERQTDMDAPCEYDQEFPEIVALLTSFSYSQLIL